MKTIRKNHRRGAVAALAMIYLMLFGTLASAMFFMATLSVQTADNYSDMDHARSAAESGLRWMQYRFIKMNRPKTTTGTITSSVAAGLWPSIQTSISTDLASMIKSSERAVSIIGSGSSASLTTSWVSMDEDKGKFRINIIPDATDSRILRVTSTGSYGASTRSVTMQFRIDKKVKYAIVGKVPIQIGRNVMVEGPIAMPTAGKYPPVYALSDFRNLKSSLTTKIDNFNNYLETHHSGYDNRISSANTSEWNAAIGSGYPDRSGDGFIDEYDLFLGEFDANSDKMITQAEFTNPSTGKLYDADLFDTIDGLGGPLSAGDVTRSGYKDGIVDNRDGYAKIRGQVALGTTAAAWNSNLAPSGQVINDMMRGPISPTDYGDSPTKFGITTADIFDLSPSNFNTTSGSNNFKSRTGTAAGATVQTSTLIKNKVLAVSDANGGTASERTPYGSTSYQATYARPVFRNLTLENVQIPIGLNALFDNCTFKGTTFVGMTTNITNSSGQTTTNQTDGMTWSKRMKSGTFATTTALTATNSWGFAQGNNLRFNDCTVEGPIASDVPTAYTHFTNSWEFTGATRFNNLADQTATIVAPQTNIEMGSFTNPGTAPSTLVGVVVAGNIDIRGSSFVDGSIIVTGDGAGNTTVGWFGASDASTDPTSPMPEGGWGKLTLRYNPNRALPDGINVAIDILPDVTTYVEGN